tara:strand:+ start:527 stop:1630 length:1104 start_codon:yes stop_codon:yes gene_type:complete
MIESVAFVRLDRQYQRYKDEIDAAMLSVAASGQYVMGPVVEEFEKGLAKICGTRFAVALANGTDALVLAMLALDIGNGDEVITSPNSFIASAGSIVQVGARPVFVDIREDHNIDSTAIAEKITRRTKAIMAVHLTGRPAAMEQIRQIADNHGIYVIEDAAQAIGATLNGRAVGSFGDFGCFSLHPLKNIFVMGDAGFLTCSCPHLYQRIRRLQNHGLINRDTAACWGMNSRLDSIHCAVGLVKLKYFESITKRFRDVAKRYQDGLSDVVRVPLDRDGEQAVYHNFVIDCERRDDLMEYMAANGVETKIHYPLLLHTQPAARSLDYKLGDFPVAEKMNARQLSLPIYPEIREDETEHVISCVRSFYGM